MLGTGGGPIEFSERMYHLYYTNQVKKASVYAIPSGTIGTLSSEISMYFGLRGPSHVISTGCTSSTDALGYAFRSIRFGAGDTQELRDYGRIAAVAAPRVGVASESAIVAQPVPAAEIH